VYIIDGPFVYKREGGEEDGFINDVYIGPLKKPKIEVSKKVISVGEHLIVSLSWVRFDLDIGDYILDQECRNDYIVEVATENGEIIHSSEVLFGETFDFYTETPGTYNLHVRGENAGGNLLEITVIPETAEDKFYRLEQQNLILMGALADLYEEILTLKEGAEE
jgi:hypothetical protein